MDRKIFKTTFQESGFTRYPCPLCGDGKLRVKKGSFQYSQTNSSKRESKYEHWDPEWVEYVYSCLFECRSCKDTIASSGTGSVAMEYAFDDEGNPDVEYRDYFRPNYFYPHLKIFSVPKETDESISDEIDISFSLFFCDPDSAANHIRVALEHLLTSLNVKRFSKKNGKRNFLSLHSRIDLLPVKFNDIKEMFFAIKWLGNAGSHSHHEVTKDDVLDSYELMNEILIEIYSSKRKKAKSLAKIIVKKKGPK